MRTTTNWRKVKFLALCFSMSSVLIVTAQNCSQVNFDADAWHKEVGASDDSLDEVQGLAYGETAEDRQFLQNKLDRYKAPGLDEIFSKWRRISGPALYNSVSEINVSTSSNSYCASTLDGTTGVWASTTNPSTGKTISPGTDSTCINEGWFSAISWVYLTTGRLHHATNSDNFNGFISGVKLDQYTHRATVTSANTDDDEIALIIASVVDSDGIVHTLSASRSQGGFPSPTSTANWYLMYRKGNTQVKAFGAQTVGTLNTAGSNGDKKGWNGRKSLIQVERTGDIISAKTSDWATDDSQLALSDSSEIKIDLSDSTLGLEMFKGKQYYGYGVRSQPYSQFYDVSLTTPIDQNYVYDLLNNIVYSANSSGYYDVVPNVIPHDYLGRTVRVVNTETQKTFRLYSNGTFKEITE